MGRTGRSGGKDSAFSRFFRIAGITIRVFSDLPIRDDTFASKFEKFRVPRSRRADARIEHHFSLPMIDPGKTGRRVYQAAPWSIYRQGSRWTYVGARPKCGASGIFCVAFFNAAHSRGRIHHEDGALFAQGGLHSLSLFPTDQIWLARTLAERRALIIHAAGMKIAGRGLLFAGHSRAGKSTAVTMLQGDGEILCDDRIVIRRWPKGFKIHGTWSHGDVPHVSAAAASLRAILFLEKSRANRLIPIRDPRERLRRILPLLVKPLVSSDWWEKTLGVVDGLVGEVPAYRLQFDKSGKIQGTIRRLLAEPEKASCPRRRTGLSRSGLPSRKKA